MDVVARNVSVQMYLPSLAELGVEPAALPDGFALRRYRCCPRPHSFHREPHPAA